MRATGSTLLIVVGIFLALCTGIFLVNLWQSRDAQSATQQLAIDTTESVFAANDFQPLLQVAHSRLLADRSPGSLATELSAISARLGPLTAIDSISGSASVPLLPFGNDAARASYSILLQFESGPATVAIALEQAGSSWQITAFEVQAERLYQ